jgi:hypothetical protein
VYSTVERAAAVVVGPPSVLLQEPFFRAFAAGFSGESVTKLMAKNYIDNLSEETRKGMNEKAVEGFFPSRAPSATGTSSVLTARSRFPIAVVLLRFEFQDDRNASQAPGFPSFAACLRVPFCDAPSFALISPYLAPTAAHVLVCGHLDGPPLCHTSLLGRSDSARRADLSPTAQRLFVDP